MVHCLYTGGLKENSWKVIPPYQSDQNPKGSLDSDILISEISGTCIQQKLYKINDEAIRSGGQIWTVFDKKRSVLWLTSAIKMHVTSLGTVLQRLQRLLQELQGRKRNTYTESVRNVFYECKSMANRKSDSWQTLLARDRSNCLWNPIWRSHCPWSTSNTRSIMSAQ